MTDSLKDNQLTYPAEFSVFEDDEKAAVDKLYKELDTLKDAIQASINENFEKEKSPAEISTKGYNVFEVQKLISLAVADLEQAYANKAKLTGFKEQLLVVQNDVERCIPISLQKMASELSALDALRKRVAQTDAVLKDKASANERFKITQTIIQLHTSVKKYLKEAYLDANGELKLQKRIDLHKDLFDTFYKSALEKLTALRKGMEFVYPSVASLPEGFEILPVEKLIKESKTLLDDLKKQEDNRHQFDQVISMENAELLKDSRLRDSVVFNLELFHADDYPTGVALLKAEEPDGQRDKNNPRNRRVLGVAIIIDSTHDDASVVFEITPPEQLNSAGKEIQPKKFIYNFNPYPIGSAPIYFTQKEVVNLNPRGKWKIKVIGVEGDEHRVKDIKFAFMLSQDKG